MSKKLKVLVILLLLVLVSYIFLEINRLNYTKLKEVKLNIVKHPDNLKTKEFEKALSFWFENSRADIFWLETI